MLSALCAFSRAGKDHRFLARYRKTLLVAGFRKRGDKKRNVI
jgi:hypothetical protein